MEIFYNDLVYDNGAYCAIGLFKTEKAEVTYTDVKDGIAQRLIEAMTDYKKELKRENPGITNDEIADTIGEFVKRYLPDADIDITSFDTIFDSIIKSWYMEKVFTSLYYSMEKEQATTGMGKEEKKAKVNMFAGLSGEEKENIEKLYDENDLLTFLEALLSLNS